MDKGVRWIHRSMNEFSYSELRVGLFWVEAVWKHKHLIRISANGSTDLLYFGLLKIFSVKNDLSAPN